MAEIRVDGLTFTYPDNYVASKYDEWSFYLNRWQRIGNEIKAIDLLVVTPERIAWFVEVKDYRRHQRTKALELADEVAKKVFDTLAALLPAKVNGDENVETQVASGILLATKLRVVLHLEQPATHSRLFPRAIDPANVKQRLRRRIKCIDAHPLVVEMTRMADLPWAVR